MHIIVIVTISYVCDRTAKSSLQLQAKRNSFKKQGDIYQ